MRASGPLAKILCLGKRLANNIVLKAGRARESQPSNSLLSAMIFLPLCPMDKKQGVERELGEIKEDGNTWWEDAESGFERVKFKFPLGSSS